MRKLVISAAITLYALAAPAIAQYPSKPIRAVVPFPPGGTTDTVLRILAQPLGLALGQPVIVDNRPGADGAIAADTVLKSPPDGYTLFLGGNTSMSAMPAMRKVPPYDPITEFTPVSQVGIYSYFLFLHPGVPAKDVGELIAYIHANPGKVNCATPTSVGLLAAAQLASYAKLEVVRVPYKGEAPATIDLVSGHVQMLFASPTPAAAHAKEGRLKALATLSPRRSGLMPEVPTMVEAGAPKLSVISWGGIFGPARLPPEIVAKINRELNKILGRPDVREQFARHGVEVQGSTPEELAALTREQLAVWRAAVRDFGLASE